ncbi:Pr6Pr family membrane protein [Spiroplasma endosymbiont of Lonchoptera lutea]|uniref:Pr6Pr family membrane protein n=1 Tax=Spiroplasma endosymbiont of Lonchoptera lutea TaxID=3066297 RepID=UPI0030CB2CD1
MKPTRGKLIFKIFAFIFTIAFLIATYINSMVLKLWVPKSDLPFLYGDFTVQYLSFFTTQSNIIVAIWFLLATINYQNEDKNILTGQTSKLFITSYISVTFFVWLTVLMPTAFKDMGINAWIYGVAQHIIVPLLMIIYGIWNIGSNKIELNNYFKKNIWIYLSYPLTYIIYVMLRGEMRWADGKENLSYPYFFLNLHNKNFGMNGVLVFVIFATLILFLFIVFNLLYIFINNFKNKTWIVNINGTVF